MFGIQWEKQQTMELKSFLAAFCDWTLIKYWQENAWSSFCSVFLVFRQAQNVPAKLNKNNQRLIPRPFKTFSYFIRYQISMLAHVETKLIPRFERLIKRISSSTCLTFSVASSSTLSVKIWNIHLALSSEHIRTTPAKFNRIKNVKIWI